MKAKLRYARISAKKMRVIAALVRGMPAEQAVAILKTMPHKGSAILCKLLNSALANCDNKTDKTTLNIGSLLVDEGPFLKRFLPVARGSAHPIHKHTSHISITLSQK